MRFNTLLILGFLFMSSLGHGKMPERIPAQYERVNQEFQELASRSGHGLEPESLEDLKKKQVPQVQSVRANRLGIERLNVERREEGGTDFPTPPIFLTGEEIEVGSGDLRYASTTQPRRVDNSRLPSFPPIGSQGSQNSCVGWATTYYQLSHEYCKVHGCSYSQSGTQAVFSPSWTYNMINNGQNVGTFYSKAYAVITKNGAAKLSEMPYLGNDFRRWDLQPEDWWNALRTRGTFASMNRMNEDIGMNNAKQLLANGRVLVFGTYINSWTNYLVGSAPGANNSVTGQKIGVMVDGFAGSHAMTIVGYDDTVWVDLNQNTRVEPGEMGAFKVANQWGTSFGNSGFIWLSYDALRNVSAVPNGPSSPTRQQAIQGSYAYVLTIPDAYEPQLIGRVTLKTSTRNHVHVSFGASESSHIEPQVFLNTGALINQGGAYAFDGTTTAIAGTFYFDLTDLVREHPEYDTYYVIVTDTIAGSPVAISNVTLLNQQNSQIYPYQGRLPHALDNQVFRARFPASVTQPDR